MKLLRSLLFSALLFVLSISLVLITGIERISETKSEGSFQSSAILLSSGSVAATPIAGGAKEVPPDIFAASFVNAAAPAQAPIVPAAPASPELYIEAGKTFNRWDESLRKFADRVVNGQPDQVVGLYAADILELKVEQQPESNALYVASDTGVATQFGRAAVNGVIGLLAHNTSSGILFYELETGDEIEVIYGDGKSERYQVETITEFQKLDTFNPMSDFVELSSGSLLSSTQVFTRFYSGEPRVTLQTCLERNGDPNWGLRFIEAYRVP